VLRLRAEKCPSPELGTNRRPVKNVSTRREEGRGEDCVGLAYSQTQLPTRYLTSAGGDGRRNKAGTNPRRKITYVLLRAYSFHASSCSEERAVPTVNWNCRVEGPGFPPGASSFRSLMGSSLIAFRKSSLHHRPPNAPEFTIRDARESNSS
jgi:hypothetical protein